MKRLSAAEKRQIEDEAMKTDLNSLMDDKIEKRVCKTERLVISENVKTRQVVAAQTKLIKELKSSKVNDVIQYALIGLVVLSIIILHGCLQRL